MTISTYGDWFDAEAYTRKLQSNTARQGVELAKATEYDQRATWWTEDGERIALLATARARVKYHTRHITAPVRYVVALPTRYALK